jgi:hypothetical protein
MSDAPMMPDFSKTVNAALIGCTDWLERPVQNRNKIKAFVSLKINQNISLQETAFLSYSNHRRASNPTKKKQNMKATIEQIAERANQLSGSMSHGNACYAACREMGVEESEVPAVASIVSTELTNREMNPRCETPEEKSKKVAIAALVPKHLEAIAAELEIESTKRGGNWGQKAIAAIRRGQPRWEHTSEANRRATVEVEANRE